MEEYEEELITHLQHRKKIRKRTLQVPSIPSIGVNLVAGSSQEEFPPKEEEVVLEQAYLITKVTRERGIFKMMGRKMNRCRTWLPSNPICRMINNSMKKSKTDASFEKAITYANKLGTKYVQPNLKEVVITQPVSVGTIINEQTNATDQHNSTCMLVECGAPRLVREAKIDLTQPNDAKYGSFSTFGFYSENVENSSSTS